MKMSKFQDFFDFSGKCAISRIFVWQMLFRGTNENLVIKTSNLESCHPKKISIFLKKIREIMLCTEILKFCYFDLTSGNYMQETIKAYESKLS